MKLIWIPVAAVIFTSVGLAQKRDQMLELSRDVALLQDKLSAMEKTQGDKLDSLEKMVQMAIDNQSKITAAVNSMQTGLSTQQKSLTSPVAAMGAKIDTMSSEVSSLEASMAELNATNRKIQAQLADVVNTIKTLQSPPAPPGSETSLIAGGGTGGPPPGMSAETVFQSARKAQLSGQYDLAIQQFQDYLKYYGQTAQASDAQYYVGYILSTQQKHQEAVKAFDAVLEQYPDGSKTLDAMYMKGLVLSRMDQRSAAAAEYRALIRKAPTSEQASKAQENLKRLLAAPAPTPAKPKKK